MFSHKATFDYPGPTETEDRVKIVEPEGITWLDHTPLKFYIIDNPIDKSPLASNRPIEDNSDSLTKETLSYERTIISPLPPERTAIYHPINRDGKLKVLLDGEEREIRVTLVAEYFECSGILQDNFSVVELNTPDQDQIPAIAA